MRHAALLVFSLTACAGHARVADTRTLPERMQETLATLADDRMEGRRTGTPGELRAATFIAAEMRAAGLAPAGDSGFFQRVPVAMREVQGRDGTTRLLPRAAASFAALDTVEAARRRTSVNVVGVLRGRDEAARDTVVLVTAHFDHVGIGAAVNGDSVYNGADDDASGVVAMLEIARALAATGTRRTVVFAAFTGEEVGLIGTRWYLANPTVPLARMAANLNLEMIGRPDSLAGGAGKAWLTGYERSTMGDALAAGGIPIVADPRPAQNFFRRSDNYAFAQAGIPAHTLSSFGLHADYHRPSDDISRIDTAHMVAVIAAATRAVRLLADGPAPAWKEGGRP